MVRVRVKVRVTVFHWNLVCSSVVLKFLFSCKGSRVFYNFLVGSNTYRHGYG